MQVNPKLLINHITETTGAEPVKVRKSVGLEYWKGMCNFGTLDGIDLFASYLKARGISELRRFPYGLGIEIPLTDVDKETHFRHEEVSLFVGGMYQGQFEKKYKNDFRFK